jgi:hypothetical protein
MNLNVLIVEDQFLEVENSSIIFKNAGHLGTGIPKSVPGFASHGRLRRRKMGRARLYGKHSFIEEISQDTVDGNVSLFRNLNHVRV